jgi:hypothetical protein
MVHPEGLVNVGLFARCVSTITRRSPETRPLGIVKEIDVSPTAELADLTTPLIRGTVETTAETVTVCAALVVLPPGPDAVWVTSYDPAVVYVCD